ncbi:hypothetical protein [Butyrivibrio sp. INlla21]|uniref:hypothetical protein n=1 Tax=Butyrivibrio sp. INlla21 TaxID=1520811 RepID=UPI0008E41836|nr:hypothetical protein [Butyrivibrio sp. INlla21]SFU42258.1 hypothetical protein SAMN02910342_00437 [Butyrivibrio sp. INlla21]
MKKRIIVTLMSIAIAITSVACGDKVLIQPATLGTSSGIEVKASDDDSLDEADKSSTEVSTDANFTSGEVIDNVYENEFFNVKIPVSEGMVFADEVKVAELNGLVDNTITNEQLKEAMDKQGSLAVAYATDNNLSAFTVSIGSAGKIATALLSEKKIIEASKDSLISQYEGMGLTDISTSIEKTTFIGEEHECLSMTGTAQGVTFHAKVICLLKDGYIGTFAVGGPSEEVCNILDGATKLN